MEKKEEKEENKEKEEKEEKEGSKVLGAAGIFVHPGLSSMADGGASYSDHLPVLVESGEMKVLTWNVLGSGGSNGILLQEKTSKSSADQQTWEGGTINSALQQERQQRIVNATVQMAQKHQPDFINLQEMTGINIRKRGPEPGLFYVQMIKGLEERGYKASAIAGNNTLCCIFYNSQKYTIRADPAVRYKSDHLQGGQGVQASFHYKGKHTSNKSINLIAGDFNQPIAEPPSQEASDSSKNWITSAAQFDKNPLQGHSIDGGFLSMPKVLSGELATVTVNCIWGAFGKDHRGAVEDKIKSTLGEKNAITQMDRTILNPATARAFSATAISQHQQQNAVYRKLQEPMAVDQRWQIPEDLSAHVAKGRLSACAYRVDPLNGKCWLRVVYSPNASKDLIDILLHHHDSKDIEAKKPVEEDENRAYYIPNKQVPLLQVSLLKPILQNLIDKRQLSSVAYYDDGGGYLRVAVPNKSTFSQTGLWSIEDDLAHQLLLKEAASWEIGSNVQQETSVYNIPVKEFGALLKFATEALESQIDATNSLESQIDATNSHWDILVAFVRNLLTPSSSTVQEDSVKDEAKITEQSLSVSSVTLTNQNKPSNQIAFTGSEDSQKVLSSQDVEHIAPSPSVPKM